MDGFALLMPVSLGSVLASRGPGNAAEAVAQPEWTPGQHCKALRAAGAAQAVSLWRPRLQVSSRSHLRSFARKGVLSPWARNDP